MSSEEYNENSMDAVLARMEARQIANSEKLDTALRRIDGHDVKIEGLQKSQWWTSGAGAVIAFVVGKIWK